jgi:hypothetical protein
LQITSSSSTRKQAAERVFFFVGDTIYFTRVLVRNNTARTLRRCGVVLAALFSSGAKLAPSLLVVDAGEAQASPSLAPAPLSAALQGACRALSLAAQPTVDADASPPALPTLPAAAAGAAAAAAASSAPPASQPSAMDVERTSAPPAEPADPLRVLSEALFVVPLKHIQSPPQLSPTQLPAVYATLRALTVDQYQQLLSAASVDTSSWSRIAQYARVAIVRVARLREICYRYAVPVVCMRATHL